MTRNLSNDEVARLIKSELLYDELPLSDEYSVTPDSQLDSKIESSDLGIYEEINDDFIKESIINRNKFQKLNNYQRDYLKRILDRKVVSISSLAKEFSICKSTLYRIKH